MAKATAPALSPGPTTPAVKANVGPCLLGISDEEPRVWRGQGSDAEPGGSPSLPKKCSEGVGRTPTATWKSPLDGGLVHGRL